MNFKINVYEIVNVLEEAKYVHRKFYTLVILNFS